MFEMMKPRMLAPLQALICRGIVALSVSALCSADTAPGQVKSLENLLIDLTNHNAGIREAAMYQLRDLKGPAVAKVVPSLATSLKDEDTFVSLQAAETLETIGPPAAEALPNLIEIYFQPDYMDIGRAFRALRSIGFIGRSTDT